MTTDARTTAPARDAASRGGRGSRTAAPLLLAGLVSAGLVALTAALAGALADGGSVGYAVLGGLLGAGVLAAGALLLHPVAVVAPHLSLVFAVLSFGLQVAVVLAVLLSLDRADAGTAAERGWMFATLVVSTLAWLAAHATGVARECRRTDVEEGLRAC